MLLIFCIAHTTTPFTTIREAIILIFHQTFHYLKLRCLFGLASVFFFYILIHFMDFYTNGEIGMCIH